MRIRAVKDWYPLHPSRAFPIGPSYRGDLEDAVPVEHSCEGCCDVRRALDAGFPLVASHLLSGAMEIPLIHAVERAHRFNGTLGDDDVDFESEWKKWLAFWDETEAEGRVWKCSACSSWTWESDACGFCAAARPPASSPTSATAAS